MRSSEALRIIQQRLERTQGLIQHVVDQVGQLHERFDRLDTALNNNTPARLAGSVPRRQHMPSKPRVFLGRSDSLQEITHLLCSETNSRICVLGPGGMGKTSLALAVVESPVVQEKYGSRCFWVPCIEAFSPGLLLQVLYVHLRVARATDDTLDDIVSELNRTKEPRLILLDNFETPWFPTDGTRQEVGTILRRISQLTHVAILMTMRGRDPPCDDIKWQPKHLDAVDEESSRCIFHEIYPQSEEDPDVDNLSAALGRMPFALTLMAEVGRKSGSSAKELMVEWSESGTDTISSTSSPEANMNRSIGLSFRLIQQDPNALLLLQTLSLLPAGTSKANLNWWAPDLKSRSTAIATLSDAALLIRHSSYAETTLFVVPVVQSFMSTTNRILKSTRESIQEACYRYVLDHRCRYHETDFNEKSEALAAEDTNIQSILLSLNVSERVIEVLLHFTWYRFDTRPSIDIAQRTLAQAKSLGQDRYIAEALCVLGGTYWRLSKEEIAMDCLTKAWQLFDKLLDESGVSRIAAECVALLVDARMNCDMPPDSTLDWVLQVQPKFSDDFDRAHVLKALGLCHLRQGDHLEGIKVLNEAKDIFKQVKNPTDMGHSLIRIARNYRGLSQFQKALEAMEEASSVIQDVNHPRMRADIECQYARVLLGMRRYAEARSKFEVCFSSFQRLGSLMMMGEMLEEIADTYMFNDEDEDPQRYQRATVAYEAALEKYTEINPRSPLARGGIERCEKQLDTLKTKTCAEL